jgi:hypothetical protein
LGAHKRQHRARIETRTRLTTHQFNDKEHIMTTQSTWSINDLSVKGISAAIASNPSAQATYGNQIATGYTTYQAAFSALPALAVANPAASLKIVRQDVLDGGAIQYAVQN